MAYYTIDYLTTRCCGQPCVNSQQFSFVGNDNGGCLFLHAGGITVDPKQLSERELEKLTRKLVQVGFCSVFRAFGAGFLLAYRVDKRNVPNIDC